MSETFKTDLMLFLAAFIAIVVVLGKDVSVAEILAVVTKVL